MGPGEDQSVLQLEKQKAFQKLITKYDSRPKAQPSTGDPISLLILLLMDLECYLKFLAGVGGGVAMCLLITKNDLALSGKVVFSNPTCSFKRSGL